MRRILATVAVIAIVGAACGGGSSAPSSLADVRAELVDAGFSCPRGPEPHRSDDGGTAGDMDPVEDLACKKDGVSFTVSRWQNAGHLKVSAAVGAALMCGFGMESFSFVSAHSWMIVVDRSGSSETAREKAVLAAAGDALGTRVKVHRCEKSADGPALSDSDSGSDDTTAVPETTATSAPADDGRGSRAEPLKVGEGARIGEWDVTVDRIVVDATAEVQGANQFNDPPMHGRYAKVVYTATYRGDGEETAAYDLRVVLSGSDHVQYQDTDCQASLGDSNYATLEPGGTTTVAACLDAPAAAIAGGLVFVKDQASFDDTARAYWRIP